MPGEQTNCIVCGLAGDPGTIAEGAISICTFLSSACTGVCPTAAPLQEQIQDKTFAVSLIAAGKAQTALFKPLPPDLPSSLSLLLPVGASCPRKRERKGEGSQRTSLGNETALLACLSLSWVLLPTPCLGSQSHSLPLRVTVHVFCCPASGYG